MLLSLFLAWGLLACGSGPVEAPFHPSGRVRTASGEPVAGAHVHVTLWSGGSFGHGQPADKAEVITDADGRWEATLGLGTEWSSDRERVKVLITVTAEGFIRERESHSAWPGDDTPTFSVLVPARRVYLRCLGRPEQSCFRKGHYTPVRCGPAGSRNDLVDAHLRSEGREWVDCPDVPDLEVEVEDQVMTPAPGESELTFDLRGTK